MKSTYLLFLFIITLLTACSSDKTCDNRLSFISANEPDSLFQLDFTKNPFDHLNEMNEFYKTDLCKDCKKVTYCTPLKIEGKMGYLPLFAEFEQAFCPNCPVYMRLRNSFQILLNANHDVLVEGEPCTIGSLDSALTDYLSKVAKHEFYPDSYDRVIYSLQTDSEVTREFKESVLTIIYSSHLNFVENQLAQKNIVFCDLTKEEVLELKKEYPINIEMYRKIKPPSPPFIYYLEVLSPEWSHEETYYLAMDEDSIYNKIEVDDTTNFPNYIINKSYHKELNDSIHVKKSIRFNPKNGSKLAETDVYIKPITLDLESRLTLSLDFNKKEIVSFYIDSIGSEAKMAANRKKLDELKNDSTNDGYYICGTAYFGILWEGIPAFAVPEEIPLDSALSVLKQWRGYTVSFLGE